METHISKSTLLLFLFLLFSNTCQAEQVYDITLLGLSDSQHTRNDGYQFNEAIELNSSGHVAGAAARYDGSIFLGRSVWFYDGENSFEIGLTDDEHTSNTGVQYNNFVTLNDAGQVAGFTPRYVGTRSNGSSAWLFNGEETVRIGLYDEISTRNDGFQQNLIEHMNQDGIVIGIASRFDGSLFMGKRAWLYKDMKTEEIGLTGDTFTRNDGYQLNSVGDLLNETGVVVGITQRFIGSQFSGVSPWYFDGNSVVEIGLISDGYVRDDGYQSNSVVELNRTGHVIGHASRYEDMLSRGTSAWIYDGNNIFEIGLSGGIYTNGDGYQQSLGKQINTAGQVLGTAQIFVGSVYATYTTWLYDGNTTFEIGLTGSDYVRADGFRSSEPFALNEAGKAVGTTLRGGESISLGKSVWLYDGSASFEIGLTDRAHTRSNGHRLSQPVAMNESGQVIGFTYRNNEDRPAGMSTWLFDGINTHLIGLRDDVHTREDGYQWNTVKMLNESGQAMGSGRRYDASGFRIRGGTAWFYDPEHDQTYGRDFSVRASDGFAFSEGVYLGENGIMLGYYHLYEDGNDLVKRAFWFSVEGGFVDLNLKVSGFDESDWAALEEIIESNNTGDILGTGMLEDIPGQAAFLLTPKITDSDEDGVLDDSDMCINTQAQKIVNSAGCSIYQLVPCDGPMGSDEFWGNHGKYISEMNKIVNSFVELGLINIIETGKIISEAAKSSCGKK